MAGEVVGTAFVRIKALTSGLAKDIESNVKKGMDGAGLDKIGSDAGDELGENLGGSAVDSAKKTIKKKSKGIFQDVADQAKATSKELRESFASGDLDFSFFDEKSSLDKFFDRIKVKLNSVDLSLRDFFGRTAAGFRNIGKDDSGIDDTLEKIGKRLKSFGDGGFTDAIGKLPLALGGIGAAIVGALPYIQDVGAAILAYATGLVAQVGFLATALGGIGVAAGAAIGTAATVALPLVLAFKSETEALVTFKDSLKAAGEEFLRIGTATQATLLPALDEALFIIQDLVEPLSEFGLLVGRAVGNFAIFAANILTGEVAMGRFQDILQSALRILDILLPTVLNVGNILSGVWVAALPAAERLVGSIGDLVQRWSDMVDEGLRTGELTATLDLWYDRAALLGSALGNLSASLFDILQIGGDSSDSVFRRFDEWTERYRAFTESEAGQNKIALIFDNALEVMREVNGVAADLFDGIFGRLGEIGGVDSIVDALQRFREVLPGIQEEWSVLYDRIKSVVEFLFDNVQGKFAQAVEKLAEPLGRLGTQILDLLDAMNDSGAFEVFLELLKIMTNVLSSLLAIPGFGTFIGYMLAFGSAAKVAKIALGPFISVLGSLVVEMVNLARAQAGKTLGDTAGALSRFVAGFKGAGPTVAAAGTQVATAATGVATNATGMAGSIGTGVAALGGLALPLGIAAGALAIGGIAFYNHQQSVQKWRQEIGQATEALGTLNEGLLITAEGIAKYLGESSRFESRNQGDDLARLGFTFESLAGQIETGSLSLSEFIDTALAAGEVSISTVAPGAGNVAVEQNISSLEELQRQYNLTDEQLQRFVETQSINVDGTEIALDRNSDLVDSFMELNKVLGAGVKESIGDFVIDSTNIDLLGPEFLNDLKTNIDAATDEEAVQLMRGAFDSLGVAAREASAGIVGVSEETRRQISEQAAGAGSAAQVAVEEYRLLQREQQRVFAQINADFELFNSDEFIAEFGSARQAVVDFSTVVDFTDLSGFDLTNFVGGVDALVQSFPGVASATQNLFDQLRGLPEDEFNAAATAMGADAETLRGAVDGAYQALSDLQENALATLPSVGSLLEDAMGVREDGEQFFDPQAFLGAARERIEDTNAFADNITEIQRVFGDETARLAAQQGPEAAAAFREMAGSDPESVNQIIADMEAAEAALSTQISTVLGPGIAVEYAAAAGLVGTQTTIGLSNGLSNPAAVAALSNSATDLLNVFSNTFRAHLAIVNGELRFIRSIGNSNPGLIRTVAGGGKFSEGGFVGNEPLFNGPSGTDTVNAWLTPGEFVLRRAVAQAIPHGILTSLNAGDPRMIGLLNSLNRSRPAGVDSVVASVTATPAQAAGGNFVIHQMNIEAPTPLESARQVADRLRIMQSQLSSR